MAEFWESLEDALDHKCRESTDDFVGCASLEYGCQVAGASRNLLAAEVRRLRAERDAAISERDEARIVSDHHKESAADLEKERDAVVAREAEVRGPLAEKVYQHIMNWATVDWSDDRGRDIKELASSVRRLIRRPATYGTRCAVLHFNAKGEPAPCPDEGRGS